MSITLKQAAQQALDALVKSKNALEVLWVSHHANRTDYAIEELRTAIQQATQAEVTDEREAFEAEMRCEDVWGHRSLKKRADGCYENRLVDLMWDVWQARSKLTLPALRPVQVPMTDDYKQVDGSKNCMQCAAAYMLGLPLDAVPDFEQAGSEAWEAFYAFFAGHGYTAEMFPPSVEIDGDYLASGQTTRGTSHMVVMRGGKLLHDPHPSNAGLKSVQVVWLITRKAGRNHGITAQAKKEKP